MNQPDCARCGGTEGELSYDTKKANKGIRIHLTTYEGHKDTYYCSIKCLNIIKDNIKKRLQALKRREKEREIYKAKLTKALHESRRLYACKIAAMLPCPTKEFANERYPAILALVNHWKNEKFRLEDDAKRVTLVWRYPLQIPSVPLRR